MAQSAAETDLVINQRRTNSIDIFNGQRQNQPQAKRANIWTYAKKSHIRNSTFQHQLQRSQTDHSSTDHRITIATFTVRGLFNIRLKDKVLSTKRLFICRSEGEVGRLLFKVKTLQKQSLLRKTVLFQSKILFCFSRITRLTLLFHKRWFVTGRLWWKCELKRVYREDAAAALRGSVVCF